MEVYLKQTSYKTWTLGKNKRREKEMKRRNKEKERERRHVHGENFMTQEHCRVRAKKRLRFRKERTARYGIMDSRVRMLPGGTGRGLSFFPQQPCHATIRL